MNGDELLRISQECRRPKDDPDVDHRGNCLKCFAAYEALDNERTIREAYVTGVEAEIERLHRMIAEGVGPEDMEGQPNINHPD